MNLLGKTELIIQAMDYLQKNLPVDWANYVQSELRFRDGYYWFKYVGHKYPSFYLYVCIKDQDANKATFMILPDNNNDFDTINDNCVPIIHSLFDGFLGSEISLEE